MKGFFALPINNKTKKQSTKTFTCNSCGLYKDVLSPKMKPTGNFKKGIMNIGIAPDVQDDDSGKHWQGLDGRFLRQTYRSLGIDLHEDCINLNAINCFTDKKNINFEIDCCRRIVLDYIQKYKPKVIITFGIEPLQSIIGDRFLRTLGGIEKWRGWTIPDQDLQAWVCPTISPKYVLSNDNNKGINITWLQDLERAISKLDEPFPFHKEPELIYLEKDLSVLNEIPNISTIAFDFETTGLKPDAEGHKIISAAVAVSPDKTYVFMLPDNPEDRKPFIDLLKNKHIKKIAQNCKYEHSWSKVLLNTTVQNWHWDTQLATHILDNRDGITSLSFQTYVNFGVIDYDSEVTNYLKAPDSNSINRIEELTQIPKGKQALLKYNALDTIFEYRLYEKQYKHYEEIKDAYDLFHKGIFALGEAERNGFFLDVDLMEKEKQKITKKVTELEQQIFNSSFYKEWQKTSSTEINMYSSQQLGDYLYKYKKIKPKKETATGKGSTNEESLRALNIPELDLLLQIKKLNKIKGTYIAQFEREVVNDRVHPSFNLHFVKSFRSCIAKGTNILVARDFEKHPNGIPIEDVKVGDYVYCFNDKLEPDVRKVLWAGKTGHKKVVRLHWSSKGGRGQGYLDLTPEHKIRLIDGSYVAVKDLKDDYRTDEERKKRYPKIRVLSCGKTKDALTFTGHLKHGKGVLEHRLLYEKFIGNLSEKDVVHHIDGNHYNHELSNLKKMTPVTHGRHHALNMCPEQRKRSNQALHDNRWKIKHLSGEEHPNYLGLSKYTCLRILAEYKGKITKVKEKYDFDTFKKYLEIHKINPKDVYKRYSYSGQYIWKSILEKNQHLGRTKVRDLIGCCNFYTLLELYDYYGISKKRKWGNQFGEFDVGNHFITKIEHINKTVDVYDLEVEGVHNFIANEICVHNSSANPNFQNIPIRDKVARDITRGMIYPSYGNQLLELDYSQLEVRISAAYSKDPVLEYDVLHGDMHRDIAIELFKIKDFQKSNPVHSLLRGAAKNGFVFPQFYGDYYKNCTMNLAQNWCELPKGKWKKGQGIKTDELGYPFISDYLIANKISNFTVFENHVMEVENHFWKERYMLHDKWRNEIWELYQKQGFVESYTGFKFAGLMRRNEVMNYPIQGAAFHCLLWSFEQGMKALKRERMQTVIIGQIHDAIVFDVFPPELEKVLKIMNCIMCNDVRQHWNWITVPLEIGAEISPVNGSWAEKKDLDLSKYI